MANKPSQKFKVVTRLKPAGTKINLRGSLPGERANKGEATNIAVTAYDSEHRKTITLLQKLAEGGEGAVFTTNIPGHVAKIYKKEKLTTDRKAKIEIMVSKQIVRKAICFPEAIIENEQREFVGYLMPQAKGIELGKSVFQPKLLLQKFPSWNKRDLVQLCLTILEEIRFLNDLNVILGDINPMNILVVSPKEVYFVDCDSYQIEGYPCTVGTANFSAPEIMDRDYATFLRTQEMENFAIATLMFMIMLPGKAPYSAVGGTSPAGNIKNGEFPYPHLGNDTDKTPPGKWGFIWSHMSYRIRLAFYETFKKGEKHFNPKDRYSAREWIEEFKAYLWALKPNKMPETDEMALDIFPTREKKKICKICGKSYIPDKSCKTPLCNQCQAKQQAKRNQAKAKPQNTTSRTYSVAASNTATRKTQAQTKTKQPTTTYKQSKPNASTPKTYTAPKKTTTTYNASQGNNDNKDAVKTNDEDNGCSILAGAFFIPLVIGIVTGNIMILGLAYLIFFVLAFWYIKKNK